MSRLVFTDMARKARTAPSRATGGIRLGCFEVSELASPVHARKLATGKPDSRRQVSCHHSARRGWGSPSMKASKQARETARTRQRRPPAHSISWMLLVARAGARQTPSWVVGDEPIETRARTSPAGSPCCGIEGRRAAALMIAGASSMQGRAGPRGPWANGRAGTVQAPRQNV